MNHQLLDELVSICGLTLSPAEREKLMSELSSILEFVDQIRTFPTEHVVPLTHPIEAGTARIGDEPKPVKISDLHRSETTEFVENFYLVPIVIEP